MTETDLERLAVLAEQTADQLHGALNDVQTLRTRMLSLIEEMGGDRTYNWDLQADLGNAETGIWSASQKARTIARNARTPKAPNIALQAAERPV